MNWSQRLYLKYTQFSSVSTLFKIQAVGTEITHEENLLNPNETIIYILIPAIFFTECPSWRSVLFFVLFTQTTGLKFGIKIRNLAAFKGNCAPLRNTDWRRPKLPFMSKWKWEVFRSRNRKNRTDVKWLIPIWKVRVSQKLRISNIVLRWRRPRCNIKTKQKSSMSAA